MNGSFAAMISCVKSAGLNVERRDRSLIAIIGTPGLGQGQMIVERMPSHAETVKAAKAADLIESKVVGRLLASPSDLDQTRRTSLAAERT